MKSVLFGLLVALVGFTAAQQQTACLNVPAGSYVPSSASCNYYYYCEASGFANHGACQPGTNFNSTLQFCDPATVDCTACSPLGGIQNLADPTNDNKYFHCNHGVRLYLQCPVNAPVFWPATGTCVPALPPTEPPTEPTTPLPQVESPCAAYPGVIVTIGDKDSCEGFNVCINGATYPGKCPDGLRWNSWLVRCDLAANVQVCWGQIHQSIEVEPIAYL